MRAAIFEAVGEPMIITDVQIAEPVGLEVLVKNAAAGLCHSDLLFMEGSWPHPTPTILGHEVAGVVVAVGADVTYLAPGDHIVGCAGGPCYKCKFCVAGRPIICTERNHDRSVEDAPRLARNGERVHQYGQLSAFADHMLIHENATVKISREIPLELASIVGCGVATGLGAVFNSARVQPGDSVAITGCGGVGLNAVQGARISGAGLIVAVDVVESKLELAKRLGATHTVNAADCDPVAEVVRITDGGAVHVIEASGVSAVAEQAIAMAGIGGKITLVGLPAQGVRISFDPSVLIPNEKTIVGSHVGSLRPRIDIPRYVDMFLRGQLDLETLVSRKITLDEVNEGFAAMQRGEVARGVIVFD
jgi:S-(hydroxymethyl)glutathione dehydrogenase/alcohol dehydrogenase